MSHPMNHLRQTKVEHSRVSRLTKGYKSGGAVKGEKSIGKKSLSLHKQEHEALHAEGSKSKHRADRPGRAKGGKVKGKHNERTVINVISGGHPAGGAVSPMPVMPPPGIGGAAMPPPMAAKPPMPMPPPGAGPGMPPGGAPPMPMRAKGGAVKSIGMHAGTKVQHMRGKGDLEQMGRGKQVTFKSGGRVRSFYAKGGSVKNKTDAGVSDRMHMGEKFKASPKEIRANDSNTTNDPTIGRPNRANGGMCRSSGGMADKVAPATRLPGGSAGGEARLAKEHRAERRG
jgi:hypothetical protein